jgi:pyruvate dehydrogenase E1 component beta subunit
MTDDTANNTFDYSKTLNLPQTDFPMRAGLPQKEPQILARWAEIDLYQRLRDDAKGRKKYVLHDGPPYANGNLHIGHALNKVLKDVITRSFQMRGFDSNYVPGWDCHGLPIEWKIEEAYRAKGRNKDEIAINEFRKECREFATHWVGVQSAEFQRLGVTGDFKNPYLTMAYDAEAVIAGELMKFAKSGQLYRGSKPIMWSVVEQTALAEAEIEYETVESDTVWVKFPVAGMASAAKRGSEKGKVQLDAFEMLSGASIVIWTTTPWTIPGNRAISFSSRISYGLYEVTAAENDFGPQPGEKLIFADKLAEEAFAKAKLGFKRLRAVAADELATITCAHPLAGFGSSSTSPLEGEDVAKRQETGSLGPQTSNSPLSAKADISPSRGESGSVPAAPIAVTAADPAIPAGTEMVKMTVREALNSAMAEEMRRDPDVFIMGEEVAEYQGAYKITQGLLQEFGPNRVVDTPITEHGFAGIGVGAAMAGLKPVVEFMTFNFAMQAIDHIINSAAKTLYMSGGQMGAPMVFRGPNGAAARVAAQHSQCYAAWYSHIPGLKVVMPYTAADAKGLLKAAIRDPNPVIFLENEILYGQSFDVPVGDFVLPVGKARIHKPGKDVTMVSFGIGMTYCLKALAELEKDGIDVELIDLRTIRPMDLPTVIESVKKTGRLVTVEEGFPQSSVGTEIATRVMQQAFDYLDAPILTIAGKDVPMPYAANLEKLALPNVGEIVQAVKTVCYR